MRTPTFSLPDQNGKLHSLKDYLGSWVVLYSYPKDNTPGCTIEACTFRDLSQDFTQKGVAILGISADSVASHAKFAQSHHLNFPLLADTDHKVLEALEAWVPKKMFGKQYMGIDRNTYIISPKGEIVKVLKKVNPLSSPKQILAEIEELKT